MEKTPKKNNVKMKRNKKQYVKMKTKKKKTNDKKYQHERKKNM